MILMNNIELIKESIAKELVQKYNMDYDEALSIVYSNPIIEQALDVVIKNKRIDKLVEKENIFIQIGIIMLVFQILKLIEKNL